MKKFIAWVLFLVLMGLITACGRNGPIEEPPEPTPTPYEQAPYYPIETVPTYIPGFDHYDVSLTIDPATRTVSGISRTTFTNRTGEPLDTIVLRVYLNAFREDAGAGHFFPEFDHSIFRHGQSFGYMDIQHVTMNNEDLDYVLMGTVLLLRPEEPLVPGETVHLVLQYDAYVPMIAYRTGANDRAMWFGMFLPVLAVLGEDGWLLPEYYPAGDPFVLGMASFEVEIITPADYIVAGTGVTTEEITLEENDTKVTIFTASNARNFAFAISPYFQRERVTTDGGDVHLYYYTEEIPVDSIMEIISVSMEYLSDRIGQYPFDHIRIVETDMFLSGVAFSNIIFMNTAALLQPDARSIGRVLGHQWFSNIVGSNPVAEPWLDRGLVRYVIAGLIYDQPEDLWAHMAAEHALLTGREDLFLAHGLEAFDNWLDYFKTHHIKGMLMFNALNSHMGEELFWELVRQYFQAFHFQIATGADFKELASEVYGYSLDDFFAEWFIGGGVPDLPVRFNGEGEAP